MSRNVSDTLKGAVNAEATAEVFIVLLTIDHDDLVTPIRVSSDGVDTTSRGEVFIAFPFDLSLPTDRARDVPRATLAIDNVDRQIVTSLRKISSAPDVTIEIVFASDPETVEVAFTDFQLRDVRYDSLVVTGDMTLDSLAAEPYPSGTFTPAGFAGMF